LREVIYIRGVGKGKRREKLEALLFQGPEEENDVFRVLSL
jgi:hypothetical protein